MDQQRSRRAFLRAGAATGLLALAACSARKPPSAATGPGGSVTITHAFGETTIPGPPKRVVSAGFTGQDDLLALGVVPVAVTNWFGDQPFGVWPWATAKLGNAKPVVLNLDNGIQVQQIAALKPDLIVATDAGLDQDTYQKLTAIAPTLPQSGGDAFFEPWKDQATAIGQAVFQSDQMKSLISGVDKGFAAVADKYPQFKNKRVLLLQGTFHDDNVVVTTGWRTDFLTQMGLAVPESVVTMADGQQRALVAHDKIRSVLDGADVLIWTTESDKDQAALLANPDVASARSRSVFTTKDQAGAIAYASPLSYPLVTDQLPPLIANILH
ncbi:ABC transporter substrate-binding protein [Mycobacterium cookii]|uniref:Iron ABC transporter substrate-binding protein n=1 Tax=Mycobacterium cookii TaxID=1775 RepID=A0A7I7L0R6_9MYCO|nr:ABC transporter substrate-binding protein [Mycobacterium cookii]MCV7330210.1 ABC transporter substrate-binding protein [Mycobacterium cookii]BBX47606.1 iron ABC transporter substrate-binding protein [Mycobacterium cookii]